MIGELLGVVEQLRLEFVGVRVVLRLEHHQEQGMESIAAVSR